MQLTRHKRRFHEASETEETVNKKSMILAEFDINSRKEKQDGIMNIKYKCKVCGERFKHYMQLTRHKRRVHEGNKMPFSCTSCNKGFTKEL